jgi:hypothetical protein
VQLPLAMSLFSRRRLFVFQLGLWSALDVPLSRVMCLSAPGGAAQCYLWISSLFTVVYMFPW